MQVNGLFVKPHTIKSLPFAAIHVYDNGRRVKETEEEPNQLVLHHSYGVFGQVGATSSAFVPGALRAYVKGEITGFDIFNAFEKHLRRGFVTLNDITEASKRNRKKKAET